MIDLDSICSRLGISVKDLSKKIDLAESTIYKWKLEKEKGGAYPSFPVIKKLLENGVTVEELFGVDCRPFCPNAAKPSPTECISEPIVEYHANNKYEEILKRLEALERRNGEQRAG